MRLDELGVDVIEPGFPAASALDFEVTKALSKSVRAAKINAFCRASRTDIDIALQAVSEGAPFRFQILTVGSDIHLQHKRRMTRDECVQEIVDAVGYARSKGIDDISVAPEDATRGDHSYLRALIEAAIQAGATMVAVPDTTGAATPAEFGGLIANIREWVGPDVGISVHCHDDMGLALANALAGIQAGANEVQVTLCGIGERAGNTALEELVAVLLYKQHLYQAMTAINERLLYPTATYLIKEVGVPIARHKSIIGESVFSTEAGLHQAGLLRDPITYEFVEPGRFGRERMLQISRHSGRTAIKHSLGPHVSRICDELVEHLYQMVASSTEPNRYFTAEELVAKYWEFEQAQVTVG
jgi:2-isopropylmalate synthase